MRRILILGASLMQRPAILEAKALGCKVVAVDANPDAVCVPLVDEFKPIDLKDIPSLINFAKELQRDGGLSAVFTAATDFSFSVSSIAQALGLPSHSVEAAKNATDKARMRSCFKRDGVSCPNFIEVSSTHFDLALLSSLNFPLVVKPVDNMGARGCQLVKSADDCLIQIVETSLKYSRSGRVILEEFIEGPEFSIEGLVFNGKIHITALADRHIHFSPYFVEMGHTIPSNYPASVQEAIIDTFCKGVLSLGLTHGACKGDVFFNTKMQEPSIGEIAARLSGGYMSGWTSPYSSSVNVTNLAIRLALGEMLTESDLLSIQDNPRAFASERAYISIPGIVKEVRGLDEAKKMPNIKDIFPRASIGMEVFFPKNNVEKCGNVIAVANEYEAARSYSSRAIKNIFIRLEANNSETDSFLQSFHDDLNNERSYPPNFFLFNKDTSLTVLLERSDFVIEEEIIYPKAFLPFLDILVEPSCISMREALHKAFEIEASLKDKITSLIERRYEKNCQTELLKCYIFFVRAGLQGIIYWADCFEKK